MTVHEQLYKPFWESYAKTPLGPMRFANCKPEPKTNKDRFGYMVLGKKLNLGFRPIGTISQTKDRLGVELITSSPRGREFVEQCYRHIDVTSLGENGVELQEPYPGDETKIYITWQCANVECRAYWPAHFLWLRLGVDLLASTFEPHIREFSQTHYHA